MIVRSNHISPWCTFSIALKSVSLILFLDHPADPDLQALLVEVDVVPSDEDEHRHFRRLEERHQILAAAIGQVHQDKIRLFDRYDLHRFFRVRGFPHHLKPPFRFEEHAQSTAEDRIVAEQQYLYVRTCHVFTGPHICSAT